MIRRHRKDEMHDTYVAALESRGWSVWNTQNVTGFVDFIAIKGGRVVFVEAKSTKKDQRKTDRERSEKQAQLHQRLARAGAEVWVLRSIADVEAMEQAA